MFTSRMFDMWSSVTSKLEAQTQIQSNIQQTNLQNSSSGSIKGETQRANPARENKCRSKILAAKPSGGSLAI